MSNNEDSISHVRIHPQCGACGAAFRPGERIVARMNPAYTPQNSQKLELMLGQNAVRGSNGSTHCDTRDAGIFPANYYCLQPCCDLIFCRHPRCTRCLTADESATIHTDCFNLFRRRCRAENKLQRLWVTATWRYPWRQAPPLVLPPDDIWDPIDDVARICRIPGLRRLPAEIKQIIWDYSQPNIIGRFSAVKRLADSLSTPQQDELVALPLCDVGTWHRGEDPITCKTAMNPIVRLTVDSWGLKRIDRDSKSTKAREYRKDRHVFVVERPERLSGISVVFKVHIHHYSFWPPI